MITYKRDGNTRIQSSISGQYIAHFLLLLRTLKANIGYLHHHHFHKFSSPDETSFSNTVLQ